MSWRIHGAKGVIQDHGLSTVRASRLLLLVVLLLAAGCTQRPGPEEAAVRYLEAWQQGDFDAMYDLLSSDAREAITREQFVERYQAIEAGVGIVDTRASLAETPEADPGREQAALPFRVERNTIRLGTLSEENQLPLRWEEEAWRVEWTPSLIFAQLTPDGLVRMLPEDPARGQIVDRHGQVLAGAGPIVNLGLVPGDLDDRQAVLELLAEHLGVSPESVGAALDRSQPDWLVPVVDLTSEQAAELPDELREAPGVVMRETTVRAYPLGSAAAHVVGYLSSLTAEELEALAAHGYGETDVLGRAGIEGWAEEELAGERGGELQVVSPDGQLVATIARQEPAAGAEVRLSLDAEAQRLAVEALGDGPGSAVLLDVRSNQVLALASAPGFDPNGFVLGFSDEEWAEVSANPHQPFLNRPLEAAYPTGSVFKIVTMAAALEQEDFSPQTRFHCEGKWRGLGEDVVLHDWLPEGHGDLSLSEGLTQSCNIVFYELGQALGERDPALLAEVARGFGFGAPTGLVGPMESAGLVPDPEWKQQAGLGAWFPGDTVNLAIGQGYLQATPLQVANAVAAIARGGSLRSPLLVAEVAGPDGNRGYQAEELGLLPASAENLAAVQDAMERVTQPDGTAAQAFSGFPVPVAGKTGSAETEGDNAHAWFAGYAPADDPQVAIVVMVEERGLGSEVAAPVARRILESYLAGS